MQTRRLLQLHWPTACLICTLPPRQHSCIRSRSCVCATDNGSHLWERKLLRLIDHAAAFLHEDFKRPTPLYIHHIPDFAGVQRHPCLVERVKKNIYGTLQRTKVLSDGLLRHFSQEEYTACKADRNVYYRCKNRGQVYTVVTIDDFTVAAANE